MSDFQPPDLVPQYQVDSIEFRHDMVVVNFTDPDKATSPLVQDHTSRVIRPGDPDVDEKVYGILDDIQELINLAHVAQRNPPDRRPSGRRG